MALKTTAFDRADALGWGMRELSRRSGLSVETLYKIKAGERTPGSKTIEGLLRAFPNLSYRDLFLPGLPPQPRRGVPRVAEATAA